MINRPRATGNGKLASPFDRLAAEYDSWFEDSAVFRAEIACLDELRTELPEPRLEIGVGPGRFAAALAVGFGVDPAFNALRLARDRSIGVSRAVGEALPLRTASFGSVYLLFTLCFVAAPRRVLREAHRVLRPDGKVVVGIIPASSPWGQAILEKKKRNNPFCRQVNLLETGQAMNMLTAAGFSVIETRSALHKPPQAFTGAADSVSGVVAAAGFVVLVGEKSRHRQTEDYG